MREGTGVNIENNGDTYNGQFKDDKMNGRGVLSWLDGDSYVGEWKEG